jgi:hypothetical protein
MNQAWPKTSSLTSHTAAAGQKHFSAAAAQLRRISAAACLVPNKQQHWARIL